MDPQLTATSTPSGLIADAACGRDADAAGDAEPLRLHLGGKEAKEGWKILNAQAGPDVDYVGSCVDLSQFADASVDEIYASHVLEHLGYTRELPRCLRECIRVLKPGAPMRISVPDLQKLIWMFQDPSLNPDQRFHLMRIIYGGQMDDFDYHKTGFTFEFLLHFLRQAGFAKARRVAEHGIFDDTSKLQVLGQAISLNVVAER